MSWLPHSLGGHDGSTDPLLASVSLCYMRTPSVFSRRVVRLVSDAHESAPSIGRHHDNIQAPGAVITAGEPLPSDIFTSGCKGSINEAQKNSLPQTNSCYCRTALNLTQLLSPPGPWDAHSASPGWETGYRESGRMVVREGASLSTAPLTGW